MGRSINLRCSAYDDTPIHLLNAERWFLLGGTDEWDLADCLELCIIQ